MTAQRHLVRRQILEIRVPDRASAWPLQGALSSIQVRQVEAILDRCFTDLGDPDHLHRIDSLEVDLGRLDASDLEHDLAGKLDRALREALSESLRAEAATRARTGRDPEVGSRLELLDRFLRAGHLPWWADASRPRVVDEAAGWLLARAPAAFAAFVRSLAPDGRALSRLVRHTGDERLAGLAGALLAGSWPELAGEVGSVPAVAGAHRAVPGASPRAFRTAVWVGFLQVASLERGAFGADRSPPGEDVSGEVRPAARRASRPRGAVSGALAMSSGVGPPGGEGAAGQTEIVPPVAAPRASLWREALARAAAELGIRSSALLGGLSGALGPGTAGGAGDVLRSPVSRIQGERDGATARAGELSTEEQMAPAEEASRRPAEQVDRGEGGLFAQQKAPGAGVGERGAPEQGRPSAGQEAHAGVVERGVLGEGRPSAGEEAPGAARESEPAALAEAGLSVLEKAARAVGERGAQEGGLPSEKKALPAVGERGAQEGGHPSEEEALQAVGERGAQEGGLPSEEKALHAARGSDLAALAKGERSAEEEAARAGVGERGAREGGLPSEEKALHGGAESGALAGDGRSVAPGGMDNAAWSAPAAPGAEVEGGTRNVLAAPGAEVASGARSLLASPAAEVGAGTRGALDSSSAREGDGTRVVPGAEQDELDGILARLSDGEGPLRAVLGVLRGAAREALGRGARWLEVLRELDRRASERGLLAPETAPALLGALRWIVEQGGLTAGASGRLAAALGGGDRDGEASPLERAILDELRRRLRGDSTLEGGGRPANSRGAGEEAIAPGSKRPVAPPPSGRGAARIPERGASLLEREAAGAGEEDIQVETAGLVVLWPFLRHLFQRLELLADGQFRDPAARVRAAGLLHHLATGDQEPQEYQLPLARVLSGLEMTEVVDFGPPVTEPEAEECANLLAAAIASAPILGEMSIAGFRGSFLLRSGVLGTRDGAWLLRVEREAYDVVLDRFPWALSWVKLPWMEAPLCVEW